MPFCYLAVAKVAQVCTENEQRFLYFTPKSFLELIVLYKRLLAKKRAETHANMLRFANGSVRLKDLSEQVSGMEDELKALSTILDSGRAAGEGSLEAGQVQEQWADAVRKVELARKLESATLAEAGRYEEIIIELKATLEKLPGDCLLASAFISFSGGFSAKYRVKLLKQTYLPYCNGELQLSQGGVPLSSPEVCLLPTSY